PPVTNTKRVINLKGVSRRRGSRPRAAEIDDGQTGYHNRRGAGATLHSMRPRRRGRPLDFRSTAPAKPSAPSYSGAGLNRLVDPQIRDRQHAGSRAHQRQARALARWHVSFLQQALERTSPTSPPGLEPLASDAGTDGQLLRQSVQVERAARVLPELELAAADARQSAARLLGPVPNLTRLDRPDWRARPSLDPRGRLAGRRVRLPGRRTRLRGRAGVPARRARLPARRTRLPGRRARPPGRRHPLPNRRRRRPPDCA